MLSRRVLSPFALMLLLAAGCGGDEDAAVLPKGAKGGASGKAGAAGSAGTAGTSGASGAAGKSGASGTAGAAGGAGKAGGSGGSAGSPPMGGSGGNAGSSAGASGGGAAAGGAGASGKAGSSGTSGASGASAGTGGSGGAGGAGKAGGGGSAGAPAGCGAACASGLVCVGNVCLPPQPGCASDGVCLYDTHCVAGTCVPYGPGEQNPACVTIAPPEVLSPSVKCEFVAAPANDPFPLKLDVQATPMVARFKSATPSIVAPFAGGLPPGVACKLEDCNYRFGVLRVLSGKDCTLQANIGGTDLDGDGRPEWARSSSPVALADLDGDKIPEIVAYMVENYDSDSNTGAEVTMAFTNKGNGWVPLWPGASARRADNAIFDAKIPVSLESHPNWAGPSVHDVDNDGIPDIVREGYVIDGLTGILKVDSPSDYATYSTGIPAIVANLDGDLRVELTNGAHLWELDPVAKAWVADPTWSAAITTNPGWAAIAEFDGFGGVPELAVVTASHIAIHRLDHSVFANVDLDLPTFGGGPPTIADFDGDGLPEVGVATSDYYYVIDPDCQATPRAGGKCASRDQCEHAKGGPCPDFILWSRRSQDHSSRITGSSVFDFEADGKAEVVYADECFVRVYAGSDGRVLFSQYRSSSTWQENPVVADTDGDFRADLVVGSNGNFPVSACQELLEPGTEVETLFAGTICEKDGDCASKKCDAGLCRCSATSECCGGGADADCIEAGSKCAPPPAGTKGSGNTCRASFPHGRRGIRVYEDSRDRWVQSRAIWNQHAYAVTNVGEDGSIPKTSEWKNNWADPKLNNFRQNTPGAVDATLIPDLTAQVGEEAKCTLLGSTAATLEAPVCNRGTSAVGTNLVVGFYVGATKICTGTIVDPIQPGACAKASCTWNDPPKTMAGAVDVKVVPNDGAIKSECISTNNDGILKAVFCVPPKD